MIYWDIDSSKTGSETYLAGGPPDVSLQPVLALAIENVEAH